MDIDEILGEDFLNTFDHSYGEAFASKNAQNINSGWPLENDQEETVNPEEVKNGTQAASKNNRERPQSQIYDQIISERKRRKLLNEQFLTLSGMVRGLKKMDKTSILGVTIKYMRNLQERAEMLEEKLAKEIVESAVLVRKSRIMVEQEEEGCSNENSGCSSFKQPLPEVEAKVCNNQAALKIHCEKQKGIMVKILTEMDNTLMANQIVQALHFSLTTAS